VTARRDLTDDDLHAIALVAAAGGRHADVAARLGVHKTTWAEIRRRDERADLAWERGRSELHQVLVSKLLERAKAGEPVPLLFALKSIFSYTEGEPRDAEDARPLVQITLPAPMSPEDYARVVSIPAPRERVAAEAGREGDDG
jgi:hypothetical protein